MNTEVEKKLSGKFLKIGTVLLLTGIIMAACGSSKEEAYRQIQVYKVDGTAEVEREPIGVLDAYANMMLQTEDIVNVSEDSNMQVKLDEDKYILLEPKTRIRLEATGNSQDSKTKIYLEEGAIVCNIENALSENSTYEVNTPNSTMAVRGTTFRVALDYDEEGNSYTVVAVFDGKVESYLIYPDGSVDEEGVEISKGYEVLIKGTDVDSMYVMTNQDISYEEYRRVTLEFLNILLDKGEDLSISKETIKTLIEEFEKSGEVISTEEMETETESENGTESTSSEKSETEVNSTESESESASESDETSNGGSSGSSGSSSGGSSDTETETETETETIYTVTFKYNGTTFATQTVTSGECASKPLLMPTAAGYWNFDFTQEITADTTIEWVSQ